jgi:hypothetical protein
MIYIETKLIVGNEELNTLSGEIMNELNDYFTEQQMKRRSIYKRLAMTSAKTK